MKRLLVIFLLLVAGSGFAQKMVVCPQWTPQAQFAGLYVAMEKGFYKEAGLDVVFKHPTSSNSAIHMLDRGEVDIITSQLVQAIMAKDGGVDLVNIMQTSRHNSLLLVSRENITGLEDLKNKKVGRWKSGFYELAQIMTSERGVNVQWVPFLSNIALFVSGAIDASLVMSYNEFFQLKLSGFEADGNKILKLSEEGFDVPEDGIYTTRSYLRQHGEQLRKFVAATARGWDWVRKAENRREGLNIVQEVMRKNNMPVDVQLQKWMLDEILRLQENPDRQAGFYLDKKVFDFTVKKLTDNLFILKPISYEDFYNDLMDR